MDKPCFRKFVRMLIDVGGLVHGRKICAGQKTMIFIDALTALSNRKMVERWQHSGDTISVILHQVAVSFMRCAHLCFRPPNVGDPTPEEIRNNPKFYPWFADCIGTWDGTHISAVVSEENKPRFRNRKGGISQNVLGVANFDMTFQYVLAGWEGSAHDNRVLNDAVGKGLPRIPGKYHLGDGGYGLTRFCLTPYRGVRYHLKEWVRGNQRPQNKRELFNLRHSSARNVNERLYGVSKKRFPILAEGHMPSYSFEFQRDLVYCAMMLHNFVRINQLYEDEFDVLDEDDIDEEDEGDQEVPVDENAENVAELNAWRDDIAQRMWDDYQRVLGERGLL
jgi:hypothetical protein